MDVGARLRHAREEKGLTLDRLSRVTRVTRPILEAIERNNPRAIPPRPYGRSFVRTYASEVGLDPEEVVREFFSQFAPVPEPVPQPAEAPAAEAIPHFPGERSPQPVVLMLAWALAAALAVVAGGWALQRAGPREAVGTSGDSTAPAAGMLGRTTAPSAPAAPVTTGVTVTLEATGPSWVTADVDGRRTIYRRLAAGEGAVLHGNREIRIRTGDAGALRWQIDGGAATLMGRPGEVRTARVTPADGSKGSRPARVFH